MIHESKQRQWEELRSRFNPDGSLLRRQQLRMLEMLICFDEICVRHDIPYWLSSGTLLGQVRHGGFIPWDDDLDVTILYKDYKRLMNILHEELPDKYVIQTPETDKGYFFCYPKLRDTKSYMEEVNRYDRIFDYKGVFIDIFTFEKFPPLLNWVACRAHGFSYKVLNDFRNTDEQARRKVRLIYWLCEHLLFPLLRWLAALCPTKELRYSPGTPYGCTSSAAELFPLRRAMFEGHLFNAPNDTHAFLTRTYGDYMQLPNLSNLHPHTYKLEILEEE